MKFFSRLSLISHIGVSIAFVVLAPWWWTYYVLPYFPAEYDVEFWVFTVGMIYILNCVWIIFKFKW